MSRKEEPQGSHIWHIENDEFTPDGWYHSDESDDIHGPFDTREVADRELANYCLWLDKGPIAEVLSIPCDLSHSTAKKAVEDFKRITGKEPTILYITEVDRQLAEKLIAGTDISIQIASNFEDDTWSVGDDRHFGVGSVGA